MKIHHAWSVYIVGALTAVAAIGAEKDPQIIERGPHHGKVVHVSSTASPEGQTALRTNHYTELTTGMHYQRNGEWLGSKGVIDIVHGREQAVNKFWLKFLVRDCSSFVEKKSFETHRFLDPN